MKKDVTMTAVAAKLLGIPVVVRHANERPLGSGPYWRALYGRLPTRHVTNAEATKRILLTSAPWLQDRDIEVIYNGVEASTYDSALPADLGIPGGALAVGFAGSFEARKGVRELVHAWREAAAAVPAAHLVLVGKGTLEAEMKASLGDTPRVHWAGYRTDMPAVLKALDVLVLPSYVEGAPNIVMEAMAAGVPVVATAVSGTPELVRDGIEARLLQPRDSGALARALVEVLSNEGLRKGFVSAASDRVRRLFGVGKMIDSYERMLTGLRPADR
ncbi:MAG: glycosyltransferase family 4 protein [Gemmatimonadaceae bacterium]